MYAKLQPGDPLAAGTLLGPLHTPQAVAAYEDASTNFAEGAPSSCAAALDTGTPPWRITCLVATSSNQPSPSQGRPVLMKQISGRRKSLPPILNVAIFDELEQAIEWNNAVPQGLSSSLWTRDIRNVGRWIGPRGLTRASSMSMLAPAGLKSVPRSEGTKYVSCSVSFLPLYSVASTNHSQSTGW